MKTFTITELSKYTTLKTRWLKEKVRKLKPKYPQYIKGGGKPGANNRYRVDIRLLDKVIERTYKPQEQGYVNLLNNVKYESYWEWFRSIEWDYFCCVSPVTEWSPERLKDFISNSGFTIFYSVHRMLKYENETLFDRPNHIHFVIMKKDKSIKMTDYKRQISGNINDFFKKFDKENKKDCFDYMLKRGKHNDTTQIVVDWGVL
jgi:hypothetical protein